jgi:ABC-type branched-subunit amino acid transport system substrate-binding protein
MRHGTFTWARTGAMVLLALTLAACGSQLDPNQVVSAGGAPAAGLDSTSDGAAPGAPVSGTTGDGAIAGAGTDVGAVPVAATGGDPFAAPVAPAAGAAGPDAGAGPAKKPSPDGKADPGGGPEAVSCDGLAAQTGVTDDTITLANASDVSGPVPGLFDSAQLGVAAYIAYFNSTSDICGRKLELLALDSRTDAAGDQMAYTRACDEAFAVVGSESIFDSGGAQTAQACGIPDLRAGALTVERSACTTCFGAQATQIGILSDGTFAFTRQQNPEATSKAAFLYLNAGGSPDLAKSFAETATSVGYGVEMLTGIEVAEFNYVPIVQQMKSKGIQYVNFVAASSQAVRMKRTMEQQGFKPAIFSVSQAQYSKEYLETGGASVEGSELPLSHPLFTDTSNTEIQLYQAWLQQVRPGADPTSFGVFAWSAARLFVQEATKLGGKLTRPSFIEAVKNVHDWDANGLHTPMDVGGKVSTKCANLVKVQGGSWTKITPGDYVCGSLFTTSVAR